MGGKRIFVPEVTYGQLTCGNYTKQYVKISSCYISKGQRPTSSVLIEGEPCLVGLGGSSEGQTFPQSVGTLPELCLACGRHQGSLPQAEVCGQRTRPTGTHLIK